MLTPQALHQSFDFHYHIIKPELHHEKLFNLKKFALAICFESANIPVVIRDILPRQQTIEALIRLPIC